MNDYTRAQSRGLRPPQCGPTGALGPLQDALQRGLVPALADLALQEYRTNPLLRQQLTPEDVRNQLLKIQNYFGPGFGNRLVTDPSQLLNDPATRWLRGQVAYVRQVIRNADARMAVMALANLSTGLIVGGLAMTAGLPVVLAAGAGAIILNTYVSRLLYPSDQPFWTDLAANLTAEGLETAGGAIGVALGGPLGGLLGTAVGAGLGQIGSNVIWGRPVDEGLLFSMAFSTAFEGTGMAAGAILGPRLRALGLDVDDAADATRRAAGLAPDADERPWKPSLREFAGRLLADEMGGFRLGPADDDVIAARLRNLDEFIGEPTGLRGDDLRRALANAGGERRAPSGRLAEARLRGFLKERVSPDIIDKVLALPPETFERLGTLPPETAKAIQAVVEDIGGDVEIYVVGGYAKRKPGIRKDIDYWWPQSSDKYWHATRTVMTEFEMELFPTPIERFYDLPGPHDVAPVWTRSDYIERLTSMTGLTVDELRTEFKLPSDWQPGEVARPYIRFRPGRPPEYVP